MALAAAVPAAHAQATPEAPGGEPRSSAPVTGPQPGVLAPDTSVLGEVVVTARKRAERLQDTPIAISVLSAEALKAKSVTNVLEVAQGLPNVTATSGSQGSSDADFFIRGVGQYDFIATNDPGVGIYIDGVYLGRSVGALLDAGDVSRIEVLRGPQGTLFGRNTIGGAVSVVTKDPSFGRPDFGVELTGGSRDRFDAEVSASAPINDANALRLTYLHRQQTGQSERDSDGATFGDVDRDSARAIWLSKLTDRLTLRVTADYTRDRGSPDPIRSAGINLAAAPAGLPTSILDQVGYADFYKTTQSNAPVNRLDTGGAAATLTYDAGAFSVKSITAYRALKAFSTGDSDGTSYRVYDQDSDTRQRQFSQELQIVGQPNNPLYNYVAGVYYFHETSKQTQALCVATIPVPDGPCGLWNQANRQTVDSYAAYGEFNWHFYPKFTLTLGGRYTYDAKTIRSIQDFDFSGIGGPVIPLVPNPFVPGATGLAADTWDSFIPKVSLDWKVRPGLLTYVTYSEGFRSGGFNGRIGVPGPIKSYDPDTNKTIEVGVKADFLNGRARINAAGFYSKYQDIQLTVTDPVLLFYVANAAEAELGGFEIESSFILVPGLKLDANLGYTHSEITKADPGLAPSRVVVGNQLPFTPEVNFDIGLQYERSLPPGYGGITARMDYSWRDDQYFSPADQPLELQKAYGLLDGRLTWHDDSGRYKVSGYVRNLTDEKYFVFGQDATFNQGVAYLHVGKPREFGVSVGYAF